MTKFLPTEIDSPLSAGTRAPLNFFATQYPTVVSSKGPPWGRTQDPAPSAVMPLRRRAVGPTRDWNEEKRPRHSPAAR
jgi:hypothetical protein